MLTHREKRMPISRGLVTRAVTAITVQNSRITLKAVKVTRKLVVVLLKVKTMAKIKGCAISVNRRIIGSIIVLHVEVKRLVQVRPKRR
jgi:2-phosphoglycerate kinase